MFNIFMQLDRKVKIAIVSFVGLSISLIIYAVYLLQFDATIYVYSIPDSLTMSYGDVKNQRISSRKDIKVKHGNHKFTFSANGFESYTTEINISKNEKKNIIFALEPVTDEAKKEYAKDKYTDIKEGIAGKKGKEATRQLENKNPAIKSLPIHGRDFYIFPCDRYRSEGDKTIGICITVTDYFNRSQIDEAFAKLKEKGINQEDYDIKVNNHIWPIEKEKSTGAVVQCRGSNPDWCYTYRDI